MRALLVVVALLLSCSRSLPARPCDTSADCVSGGVAGTCVDSPSSDSSWCVFASDGCTDGRWGDRAGDGLAGMCVGGAVADGGLPIVDAPPGTPDAPPGTPDAPPGTPDAAGGCVQSGPVPALARVLVGEFNAPILVTAPPGDPRVFVVEQGGDIEIVGETVPFLDIAVTYAGEQGLLGLAFAPDYATSRKFYVNYINAGGDTVIEQIQASVADPNLADLTTRTVVMTIDQPYTNHNGGMMAFGPDGYLYIGMGDGGSGGDPSDNGQDPNELLGKMLRIDVSSLPYSIPPGNPYAGGGGAPEVWAIGLRNPWRWSFDRATGELYIADVGQNEWEEINIQPGTTAGLNYGWDDMEGAHCYEPTTGCLTAGRVLPAHEYNHSTGGCSISGGYVYRGCAMPGLIGTYFWSDYCSGTVESLRWDSTSATDLTTWSNLSGGTIASFGEDSSGELYITTLGGEVYKIVPEP